MVARAAFVLLLSLLSLSLAELKFSGEDADIVTLASFGDAQASVSVLYNGPDASATVTGNDLCTAGDSSESPATGGYTNYTIPLTCDKGVGVDTYTVTVGDYTVEGKITVAGFVIKSDGVVVSGDDGAGVTVGQDGTYEYEVMVVGAGDSFDSTTTIKARESSGVYMKEVDFSKTSIDETKFVLSINKYRVGTGSFMIDFEAPSITVDGETFETVLKVTQETSPAPPCVVEGGEKAIEDGMVKVKMFNLLTPPLSEPVSEVVLTVDGTSTSWSTAMSSLGLPDQTVAFSASAAGAASITCDGADAYVMGDDLVVTGSVAAEDLASSLITTLPEAGADETVVTAVIRAVDASAATFPKSAAMEILAKVKSTLGASETELLDLVEGSAVMTTGSNVKTDTATSSQTDLEECFKSCDCQTELGYDCDKLTLEKASTNAVGGAAATATTAGLATWTIVLIAAVGAFALIMVIMLGLLAVYRRSADQSESDYSSSGPLGVPDPSDLLYEQSIVRDIYGRGDFPNGGPSAAVAEQRAREADLREEFPRPPSSSGLSRGSATDDASSTYSV